MDRKGIVAVFRSVSKIDWDKTGGALLNQKLRPDLTKVRSGCKTCATVCPIKAIKFD